MQRIPVNLTNDCDKNQLNYKNDLPAIRNKNYALRKPFLTDFFDRVIGKSETATVNRHFLNGPRHPILH